jgi:hypothetical protein
MSTHSRLHPDQSARTAFRRVLLASMLVGLSVPLLSVASSAADPVFEIDGGSGGANFVVNTAGNLDWESVLTGPVANDNVPAETTVFKTSSKENSAVSTWRDGNDAAPPKTDTKELYEWSRLNSEDEIEFYFGWERDKPNGTLFYTLELNAKANVPGVGGGTDFTVPSRTVGDYRFSLKDQGSGIIALVQIDEWTGSAWHCTDGAASGCDAAITPGAFLGTVNLVPTSWPAAWGPHTAPADTFVETGFNLTELIDLEPGCPGLTGFLNFRSSTGSTSSSTGENLKDYIKPLRIDGPNDCRDDLIVTKTAAASFTRTFNWGITKGDDATYHLLAGQSVSHPYEIGLTRPFTDSGWAVAGEITVSNPNDVDISGVAVTDAVSNGGTCSVTTGTGLTVPANGSLTRAYSCAYANAPSSANGTNTATATWDAATNQTPTGTASGTASFAFTNPTPINPSVTVSDEGSGDPGSLVSGNDSQDFGPFTAAGTAASYSRTFSCPTATTAYDANGLVSYVYRNVATIDQTGANDDATVTVNCHQPPQPPPGATLLIIDEDSIDDGIHYARGADRITPEGPLFFTPGEVNDDKPGVTQRDVLRFFGQNAGAQITLKTGQTGDEGWFAPACIPQKWISGGSNACLTGTARDTAIDNYFGTGAVRSQSRLDKIPAVMPLRALGLNSLVGHDVCAVVYDSDISINYDSTTFPYTSGNLQGETLGVVAFHVDETSTLDGFSSSTLPQVTLTINNAATCGAWELFNAPVPDSSSVPNDRIAPGSPTGYRALLTQALEPLFY